MRKSLVGVLVVAAMLVVGTSTARAQTQLATCSGASCSGALSDPTFLFYGPFFIQCCPGNQFEAGTIPPAIEFGVGTNGGTFTYNDISCNYGNVIVGTSCDGDVVLAASIFTPDDTGFAPGAVVSIVGPGSIEGFFCEPCSSGLTPQVTSTDATATYQFTLTAPGTISPWTLTEANFSSLPPVPEPSTLLLYGSGLFLLGIFVCRK